jgi:linoleoyl-CoA desaturase
VEVVRYSHGRVFLNECHTFASFQPLCVNVEGTEYPTTDKNGYINTSWFMNQIKSSNDMYPFSETANFILGGFNNHIAHHLFPHVHHIYYPKLNKILYNILLENGIKPNQTTYWGGLVSHLKLLRRMGYAA